MKYLNIDENMLKEHMVDQKQLLINKHSSFDEFEQIVKNGEQITINKK